MEDYQDKEFDCDEEIFSSFLIYVTQEKTLEEISIETGINLSRLKYASNKLNWVDKRSCYRNKVNKLAFETSVEQHTEQIRHFYSTNKDINNQFLSIVSKTLSKLEIQIEHLDFSNVNINQLANLLNKCSVVVSNTMQADLRLLGVFELLEAINPNSQRN